MKALFLILLLVFSLQLARAEQASFESRASLLQDLIGHFEKVCVGPDGSVLENVIAIDPFATMENGRMLRCSEEAERLNQMIKELQLEYNALLAEQNKNQTPPLESGECHPIEGAQGPLNSEQLAFLNSSESISSKLQDKKKCEKQSGRECMKDIGCNIARSVMTNALLISKLLPEKTQKKMPQCLSAEKGSCVTEFITGVLQDIWSNLKGFWELGKGILKTGKKLAVKTWDWLTGVEDKTSEAAHLASQQSNSSLKLFFKDPFGFIKKMAMDFWDMITNAIYKNFGCEEWTGVPHMSVCKKPMSSWGCSTCNQKMNAFCGVAGVLGGEIVVSYLTGGAYALAQKAMEKGAEGLGKIGMVLKKTFPVLAKTGEKGGKVMRIIKYPITKAIELGNKILHSKVVTKIVDFVKNKREALTTAMVKLSKTKPIALTIKVVKGAASPVTGYLKLLDKSYAAGMKAANRLMSKGAGAAKLAGAAEASYKLDDVDDLILDTKQFSDVSVESLKTKLKAENIPFDDIVLPDGSLAHRIKLDPSCSEGGKSSLLFR